MIFSLLLSISSNFSVKLSTKTFLSFSWCPYCTYWFKSVNPLRETNKRACILLSILSLAFCWQNLARLLLTNRDVSILEKEHLLLNRFFLRPLWFLRDACMTKVIFWKWRTGWSCNLDCCLGWFILRGLTFGGSDSGCCWGCLAGFKSSYWGLIFWSDRNNLSKLWECRPVFQLTGGAWIWIFLSFRDEASASLPQRFQCYLAHTNFIPSLFWSASI